MTDETKPVASSKVVAYIGGSDWRSISVDEWAVIDVKGKDRLWAKRNGWQIPVDNFSDAELLYLESDEDFVFKDAVIPGL